VKAVLQAKTFFSTGKSESGNAQMLDLKDHTAEWWEICTNHTCNSIYMGEEQLSNLFLWIHFTVSTDLCIQV